MAAQDWALFLIKVLFSGVAIVLIAVFLVRPVIRSLLVRPEILEYTQDYGGVDAFEMDEVEIPVEGVKPDLRTMIEEARADPNRTAALVSQWLREKK
ncbi:MAG: hypothetical protein V3S29_10260 [bacterium]